MYNELPDALISATTSKLAVEDSNAENKDLLLKMHNNVIQSIEQTMNELNNET
jgi:hypothetical protein